MGREQGGEETLPTLFLGSFAALSRATWGGGFRDRQLKEMCTSDSLLTDTSIRRTPL